MSMATTPKRSVLHPKLLAQLKRHEGLRLMLYRDSLGYTTIGYGHNLDTTPISTRAADRILRDDAEAAVRAVRRIMPWTSKLIAPRFAVLVDMAFNLGLDGLRGFVRFLQYAEQGYWDGAAREMLNSKWATQVGDRATRLATQMRAGEWQE